jgi:glycosyltransferase involved in cell wall biosynthesis
MPPEKPRVSVVTPVYNGERFLGAAIESILQQTFTDFEYILVDDASTDSSPQIVDRYAARDPRIVVMHNSRRLTTSGALNRALTLARGKYVANLDADDLALPERLARQVAYLDANPDVGVVGAQAQGFPTTPELSRWQIFFKSPVLHSAATMRHSLVLQVGGYSVSGWYANDYVLFADLLRITRIANVPDLLVEYRRHGAQMTSVVRRQQLGQVMLLIHAMLAERLELRACLDDISLLYYAVRGAQLPDEAMLLRAAELLGDIHARYVQVERLDASAFEQVAMDCAWRWLTMAWAHRRAQRAASRAILRRSVDMDPQVLRRPRTWAHLRSMVKTRRI